AAGHVDHGKTALIRALTGTDCDRLAEEKRRGVTIDIGFARLDLPDGHAVGMVDVPGHRKFVHNMMAGASGVDVALLVVAADDGVMPQTVEHLAILELLGVRRGVVALTKCDLVDTETRALASLDVQELLSPSPLAGSKIIPCSALTGEGLDLLRGELARLARENERPQGEGLFRLPIDRSFVMKGHGLVVTGALFSGAVATDDRAVLVPGGLEGRVRRIQNHGKNVPRAFAGWRVAVNLSGPEKGDLERGTVMVDPALARASTSFVARVVCHRSSPLPLAHGKSYLLAVHTAETLCRVHLADEGSLSPGGVGVAQIRFERPIHILHGDRFVLRATSADMTLGGGVVLATDEPVMGRRRLQSHAPLWQALAGPPEGALAAWIDRFPAGVELADLTARFNFPKGALLNRFRTMEGIKTFEWKGVPYACRVAAGKEIVARLAEQVAAFHAAAPAVMGIEESSLALSALPDVPPELAAYWIRRAASEKKIEYLGASLRLPGREALFTGEERNIREKVVATFRGTRFAPPKADRVHEAVALPRPVVQKVMKTLIQSGELVTLSPELTLHREVLEEGRRLLEGEIDAAGSVDTGRFRDLLGGPGRKVAIEILEHFDRIGLTRRIDNKGARTRAAKG
ncbi:MAG: selenocysteine-specific translation elongation factor, partial [Nitrospinae bacterium]|nr:selenocysteine-specific translation elongation factor [Nitrospinota bacterium]